MRQVATAILGSVLTAIYWWIVFMMVYADALYAGDRDPTAQPVSEREALTTALSPLSWACWCTRC